MNSTSDAMSRNLRIVFMGTPLFAATCLEQLLESRHEIVGVVTALIGLQDADGPCA